MAGDFYLQHIELWSEKIKVMEQEFELPVEYRGQELNFAGRIVTVGYVYKLYIMIHDEEFVFERDDDGKYRVLTEGVTYEKPVDRGLLEAVIAVLDGLSEA